MAVAAAEAVFSRMVRHPIVESEGSRTSLHNRLQKDRRKAIILMSNRDTYKYELRNGKRVVYVGITNDLERREAEHRNEGMEFTSMVKVGNATTREAAEAWESDRIATYKENHHGERPEYNQNDSGK